MPQITTQNSTVRNNDAISNSLQLGLQTLGNNLIAKRQEKLRQSEAANQAVNMMNSRPDLFGGTNAAVNIGSDGLVNGNEEYAQVQGGLFGDAPKYQTADSKAPQMISDTGSGRDIVKEATAFKAQQDNDPAYIAAKNAEIAVANEMAGGGIGLGSNNTQTSNKSIPPLLARPNATATVATPNLASVFNNPIPNTAPQTTPISNTTTATTNATTNATGNQSSSQRQGNGKKEKESGSVSFEQGDIKLQGEENSRLTMLENREAIEDEVKTSIGNLSALAMFQNVSNAATGATVNPFDDLRKYREKFISEIQGKVGYKQSTIEQKYKTGGVDINGNKVSARKGAETAINNYSDIRMNNNSGALTKPVDAGHFKSTGGTNITMYSKQPGFVYVTADNTAGVPQKEFYEDIKNGLVDLKQLTTKDPKNPYVLNQAKEVIYNGAPYVMTIQEVKNGVVTKAIVGARKNVEYPNADAQKALGLGLSGAAAQNP